ncbi:MAG TPA: T9SS type A sorting domain-containing protein [Bacteroidales bacterium]|nr:T9SS type A sorting domain-containing protein [Bacteroidales bacterium]HRZ47882.1 T9SS type A sorting domain-containing protein [Bacteroidales bacterium]
MKPVKVLAASLLLIFLCAFHQANGQSGYLVLTTITDTASLYHQAAVTLKNHRNGQLLTFNPILVDSLLPVMKSLNPRYVALVMRPGEIYINFIRKFLMMSTNVDDDPFSDFSYGFITGATGQDALNFVNKIIQAENSYIQHFPLNVGGYAASSLNMVYPYPGDYMKYLNPQAYSQIYLETSDSATGVNFFLANTGHMLNKKLLDIGHNGDPHMLWLFDGGNMNPNPPVWIYDSTKIENPAYARPGLTSQIIGSLNLYPAVAFNGACHAGVPKYVLVEGDIAATFGNTQGFIRFYTMSDTFSFALSILKTGITGYFAPCGANNANDQGEEVYNAFLFNEPLGDIHKRTVDGVVMGFLGNRPNLKLFSEWGSTSGSDVLPSGTFNPSQYSGASSMLGGKANRIYFGCPAYNPFKYNSSDSLKIAKSVIDSIGPNALDITLSFNKPDANTAYFPVWDKFHHGNTRIYLPVTLPTWCNTVTSLSVLSTSGTYDLLISAVEHFEGKTILHLEVDIPNDMYDPISFSIKFRVNVMMDVNEKSSVPGLVEIFPNPATDHFSIRFTNPQNHNYALSLFNSNGSKVLTRENLTGSEEVIPLQGLSPGLYLFRLSTPGAPESKGKIIIR